MRQRRLKKKKEKRKEGMETRREEGNNNDDNGGSMHSYRLHPVKGARRRSSSDNPRRPRQAKSQAMITRAVIAASLNGRRATVRNAV